MVQFEGTNKSIANGSVHDIYSFNVFRVANIYDVSGRLYLLKMSKGGRKHHLLIESGIRIHTTKYVKN